MKTTRRDMLPSFCLLNQLSTERHDTNFKRFYPGGQNVFLNLTKAGDDTRIRDLIRDLEESLVYQFDLSLIFSRNINIFWMFQFVRNRLSVGI